MLLLDEATSALDAASERLVQQSIDELQQRKAQTTVVIAHRLSTVRNADKICVIDGGHIVEAGTHDELLALEAKYADLVKTQMSGHEGEEDELDDDDDDVVTGQSGQNSGGKGGPAAVIVADAASTTRAILATENEGKADEGTLPAAMAQTEVEERNVDNLTAASGAVAEEEEEEEEEISKEESKRVTARVWGLILKNLPWFIVAVIGSAIFGAVFPGKFTFFVLLL